MQNGDFTSPWNSGWQKMLSLSDEERGAAVTIKIENHQLQFTGSCQFCALTQIVPIQKLAGLHLKIEFAVKACFGDGRECRRNLSGLLYLNRYVIAGLQLEYQDQQAESLGILRYVDTTSGSVLGNALLGSTPDPATRRILWKNNRLSPEWQTLEIDLYHEAVKTFALNPTEVRAILIAFFSSRHAEFEDGFGTITVNSVQLYYE